MKWEQLLCDDRIRSYKKSGSKDLRTEFEKDYHRIIGSASFRRLQDKTQVFPLDKSDFIRTRLTHSLEVSSFAKSLGQNVSEKIITVIGDEEFKSSYKADICDILQCAGLLHDIGNPPFGHFGETVIREWFEKNLSKMEFKGRPVIELLTPQMQADFYHFEGNTQALRVVTKLHYLVDEHGMNLTKALLASIIKYPVSSLEINPSSHDIKTKKMGYFYADREIFLDIENSTGTNGCRHPLAFLLEAADDIAYKTADIEDAFKKGFISYDQLKKELEKFICEHQSYSKEQKKGYQELLGSLLRKHERAIKQNMEKPDDYAVQNWVISVQGKAIASATDGFIQHYDAIMAGTYRTDLFAQTEIEPMMEALGDIACRYVFLSKPIYKLEIAAQNILEFLLKEFTGAAVYYDTDETSTAVQEKLMALISDNYKTIYHTFSKGKSLEEKLYLRLLLVTDSICGMTDSYAKMLYQELNGIG